jgi:hypothetical protein
MGGTVYPLPWYSSMLDPINNLRCFATTPAVLGARTAKGSGVGLSDGYGGGGATLELGVGLCGWLGGGLGGGGD